MSPPSRREAMSQFTKNLLAHDILTYLLEHSEAEDTIDGIVDWWLLEEKIKQRKQDVQTVLDELVEQALLTARQSKDSRVHYRINNSKTDEIRELVEKSVS